MISTPPHLTSSQFAVLRENELDSTLTKKAKGFIRDTGSIVTPLQSRSHNIDTVARGQTLEPLQLFTPTKSTNATYRWKVKVLEGDEVSVKRLIGKSCMVRKRLQSYFTAIRKGQGALGKVVLKTLEQSLKKKGLTVSFGVLHSNVPEELLGRVEKLIINVHKADGPEHVLNQRAGGGGASQRKPLTPEDIALIEKVTGRQLKLSKGAPLHSMPFALRYKKGVVYDIQNMKTGEHYVGKTIGRLSKRVSEHFSAVNTLKRASKLHRDIKKNPNDFCIRVLYTAPKRQRHILEEIESAYIRALDSYRYGYNQNEGSARHELYHTKVQRAKVL
jgi:hypothetical protein